MELLATSYRAARPLPGHLGKGSVDAKRHFVPTGFFLTQMCSSLPLNLYIFLPGVGKHSSAGHSTDPATQPETSVLAPSSTLSGMASQEWHVLDFGPFIKQWEVGAVLTNLLEILVSENEGESNLLAAGAVDLSLSHEALIICLQAAGWPAVRRQNWMSFCPQKKRRKAVRAHERFGNCSVSVTEGRASGELLVLSSVRPCSRPSSGWMHASRGINGDVAENSCTFRS